MGVSTSTGTPPRETLRDPLALAVWITDGVKQAMESVEPWHPSPPVVSTTADGRVTVGITLLSQPGEFSPDVVHLACGLCGQHLYAALTLTCRHITAHYTL